MAERNRALDTTPSVRLHFQCSFELRASSPHAEPWAELVKTLRQWVSEAPRNNPPATNSAFYGSWLFNGGEWRVPSPAYNYVRTVRLIGDGTDREPQHWAIRYEHNCDTPGRVWRIDAGVSRLAEGVFRLSLLTSHYIRPGFIGREPSTPMPTAPRVIGRLLQSDQWQAFAGSERLHLTPQVLHTGDGEEFRRRLEDPQRECPIVLISRAFHGGAPSLDALKLARLLGGSASVYESESSGLDKELEWSLGRRFSCWNGMVRVYQPGLNFDNPAAPKRQRYFSLREIVAQGHDETIDMLVQGIARRSHAKPLGMVSTIDDVLVVEREQRMAALKAAATDQSREEWIKLLEATNADLENDKNDRDDQIRQLKEELADQSDELSRVNYERKLFLARATEAEKNASAMQACVDAFSEMRKLPRSLKETMRLIEKLHVGRICFTERAYKSADDSSFDRLDDAWHCFWDMATILNDLFFKEKSTANIEKAFHEQAGFPLAMTEGELTKNDQGLMKLRRDTFQKKDIDITPHVKIDKGTTRAYFCPAPQSSGGIIVVGYIGHLKTAGTRRL